MWTLYPFCIFICDISYWESFVGFIYVGSVETFPDRSSLFNKFNYVRVYVVCFAIKRIGIKSFIWPAILNFIGITWREFESWLLFSESWSSPYKFYLLSESVVLNKVGGVFLMHTPKQFIMPFSIFWKYSRM